jgi:hypothetical protein
LGDWELVLILSFVERKPALPFSALPLLTPIFNVRTVEDFDDWTNWLFYKGGVGVKRENSWVSWCDEEQVSNHVVAC